MALLPPFNAKSLLPPGDYAITFSELRASHLVTGAGNGSTWDAAWRGHLVDGCQIMVEQLWQVGISEIILDGSFVEDKDHPSDIDGYFVCDPADLSLRVSTLNALDPYQIWTWNAQTRWLDPATGKRQLPMWHQYRTELFLDFGQSSGILDQYGHALLFPSAFRQQRSTFEPKGVIKIIPDTLGKGA
jgi:hypothetical protein